MRIVLATQHAQRAFIPLALMYLKASVAARGSCAADEVGLLEFEHDATAEAITHALVEAGPDLIGLSCYVWNIKTTLAAARMVRDRLLLPASSSADPKLAPSRLKSCGLIRMWT